MRIILAVGNLALPPREVPEANRAEPTSAGDRQMAISIFDLFKIGIGPSSSHTVGPMRAARMFAQALARDDLLGRTTGVKCELYGSLGATGKGHGSDVAVMLGLMGQTPDEVDVQAVPVMIQLARSSQTLDLLGIQTIAFREHDHLLMYRREVMA